MLLVATTTSTAASPTTSMSFPTTSMPSPTTSMSSPTSSMSSPTSNMSSPTTSISSPTTSMSISTTVSTITELPTSSFTSSTDTGVSATFVTSTSTSSTAINSSIFLTLITTTSSKVTTVAPTRIITASDSLSKTGVTETAATRPETLTMKMATSVSTSTASFTSLSITATTTTIAIATTNPTTNPTATATSITATITNTPATTKSTASMPTSILTVSTAPSTSILPTATVSDAEETSGSDDISIIAAPSTSILPTTPDVVSGTSGSDDINIMYIAIPVIVMMVITLVLIVVIVTYFYRKKRRYVLHKPISTIEEPIYNIISDPSRNSNLYETLDPRLWKRISVDQPHERSVSISSSSEASIELPRVSPEESTKYLEFNIYAEPASVQREKPNSMVFDFEKQLENPTYDILQLHNPIHMHRESMGPEDIDSSSHACTSEHNGAYPYSSIYADALPLLRSQGPPIVSGENVEEVDQLGTGHFGKVMLANTKGLSKKDLGIGNSNDTSISIKVAVKMLKASPSADVQKSFEKEIKFMSRLKDKNVIRLLGICTTGTPFIMMEYMENGDLHKYLKEQELTLTIETEKAPNEITLHTLIYMSIQIASGMKYLSLCKFIHRDLAARNILVGTDYIVKIADFGMSRNLYSSDYCRVSKQNVLPIRWMAFECFYGKFSIQTDVWAYGITLWEIFTLCKNQPFSELSDQEMIDDAVLGHCRKIPEQPERCPNDVYNIIKSCFRHEPSERASFSALHYQLKECDSYVL